MVVIDQEGDYALIVKHSQPILDEDMALLFAESTLIADTITAAPTVSLHGDGIEARRLKASTTPAD